MKDLAVYARDLLGAMPVSYGDVRFVETHLETIEVKNGVPRSVTSNTSRGIGMDDLLGIFSSYGGICKGHRPDNVKYAPPHDKTLGR